MRLPARMPLAALCASCAWLLLAAPALAAPLTQEQGGGSSTAVLGVLIAAGVLVLGGALAFWVSRMRQG
ncbi:MAG: hypothetical protein VW450_02065 [Chloroflexota bacterium]